MAASKRASKARDAAEGAWTNPYVQRIVQDPSLRDDVRVAYENLRSAYGRAANGKGPAKALLEDKKVHRDLKTAGDALRSASISLREGQKKPKKRRFGRLLFLGIVGAGLALVLSEDLRNKLLDALFGAEEEIDYIAAQLARHCPVRVIQLAATSSQTNSRSKPSARFSPRKEESRKAIESLTK